ncbi:ricin B lectin domain-containing protein [Microdochium trichocladiopsis]|uniref:Ricin B lectin domain-containing protein n=1 Tax=Microdochium trichocladiopsis TaxID=1682393 RepID=A0A9P8Y6V1_9PEZI|nr:ricin B lectin domain-containing protein [Microdochium trichocladiopsis]KAH7029458.1 ricin B lectin domain-containing protein [Microdochium trichocladiopsis]
MVHQFRNGSTLAFINYGTGTCLDLTASDPKSGTPVIGYRYNGTSNQHWKLVKVDYAGAKVFPVYWLINQATGTALDLLNASKENGTQINGWTTGDGKPNPTQLWRLVTTNANGAVVMIQNVGSGTFVDLYLGNAADRTKITGWAGNIAEENPHQLWRVKVISQDDTNDTRDESDDNSAKKKGSK